MMRQTYPGAVAVSRQASRVLFSLVLVAIGVGGPCNVAHAQSVPSKRADTEAGPQKHAEEFVAASLETRPFFTLANQVPPPAPKHGHFKFLQQVGSDFKHLPSKDSLYWLAGGGALALAVHPQDDDINRRLIPHDKFFNPGQTLGSVYVQGGSALVTYVVGRATGNEKVKHLGTDMLSAQIVAQALTQALKYGTHRERPDGSNNHSFPSGHASATFATATVLQRHLGWRAAVPTYTLATYVAMSRLQENRHFLSDVVFGAALGVVAGRTTTRHGRAHWALIPDVSKGRVAVQFAHMP
jgi:membrane-associated phospholipid phosphatase